MKFIIERNKLIKLLGKLISCVSINPKNLILSNVLLSIKNNFLFFVVTNLDIEVNYKLYISSENILESGSITVNIKKLYDLCKTFSNVNELYFKTYKNQIKIYNNRIILYLSILDVRDFPILNKNQFNFIKKFVISSILFKNIINSLYFSIGNNDIHFYLNGMLVEYFNGYYYFVTTDSYRISIYKLSNNFCINKNNNNFYFILSKKLILELSKFFSFLNDDKMVIISIDKNIIKICFDNFIIYSNLIDGIFPDYRSIICNTNNFNYIKINIDKFKDSLLRSLIISSYSFNFVTLTFNKNILYIYSNNTFNDELNEKISINYLKNKFKVNLNVKFILDILNSIKDSSKIRFFFKDNNSIIKIDNYKNKNIIYMVMPIKL